jgi:Lon protease-like protein
MIRIAELPQMIPLFPLAGALLLPRGRLPLQIFEPRYLAMIEDCMKTPARLIGMIQPRAAQGGVAGLHAIGCAGRLIGFSETEDRRYLISLSGVSRFRLQREVEGFTPYRRAEVDWSDFATDIAGNEEDRDLDREDFMRLLNRYFLSERLEAQWESLRSASTELLVNSLAMLCPFSPEDKQALLEAANLSQRRKTLVTLMEFSLRGGIDDEVLQ